MNRASRTTYRSLAFMVSLLGPVCLAVEAADIPVEVRIDEVKVYQQGAAVARRGQATIPEGTHRLIVRGLPGNIDTDTLKLSIGSPQVRLGGIEVEQIVDKEYASPQERELRAKLQNLADQRLVIQDEIATAETQLKLLDSLATTPSGGVSKPAVDATNLAAVLGTINTSATAARAAVRNAKLRQRELDRDVEKLNADLQKISTARKATVEIRASLLAAASVNAAVTVEYAVGAAQWHWVYEGRLDTNAKRVSLARQASVSQGSGEDWSNAALTLTTAQPAEDAATPTVASLFLGLQEPLRAVTMQDRRAVASPVALEEAVVVTGNKRERAEVIATDYLAEYRIPGRVTLTADNEPRLYPIAADEFSVELLARAMPSVSRSAYLEASFMFAGEVPVQGGELQLYRDGAFVGNAAIRSLLPGEEVRLPFGTDERIRVAVRSEEAQSGRRGVVSRQKVDEQRQRFEITNYHSIPLDIEVIDRVPVSEDKDVRIEIPDGATAPTTKDFEGRAGVILWKLKVQPQQTATVRHYYSVRHPADRELSSREEAQ